LHPAAGIQYTGETNCCKPHQFICFNSSAAQWSFTMIYNGRHEEKKQKVEPAVPQRRKTDEEKVSSNPIPGCLVLCFTSCFFASNDNVLGALRRLQKGLFLFFSQSCFKKK